MEEDYPRTLADLEARFSTEQACRAYLVRLRWPEGFVCPRCRGRSAWTTDRNLLVCAACGYQASATAGTIFQDSRKPLTLWFRAIWWVTTQKGGASAMGLQRILGLGSYVTAWTWLHKLRRAMVRPGRDRLWGRVEVDEAYVGGLEEGVRGREVETKALVAVACEEDGAGIGRIRLRRIEDASAASLHAFIEEAIEPGSLVHTDGWDGYSGLASKGVFAQGDRAPGSEAACDKAAAESPHRRLPAKAVAVGNPPRRRQPGVPGLLPGRVHIPVQSPQVPFARQAVLPPAAAGRCRGAGPLQSHGSWCRRSKLRTPTCRGHWSQLNTHLPGILTCVGSA
jgi:hypothetical protein